jgi:predicted ATPase
MKITRLHVTNFKSIRDLEIINPNPFSVFVGPNGAGKSNIFEALEFAIAINNTNNINEVIRLFGGGESFLNFNENIPNQSFLLETELQALLDTNLRYERSTTNGIKLQSIGVKLPINDKSKNKEVNDDNTERYKRDNQLVENFSRIFLNNVVLKKVNRDDDFSLNLDGTNLEKVLKRIFQNENKREELIEWLQVLVPEFQQIQIESSNLSGDVNYVIYEKHSKKPFPKHLISDGTKNILALLTAVYQSDEPQFLCIEEPENGLHPQVIEALVRLFRSACKEKGHYIWLNTHSQTLVRQLTVDEIIVVDKKEGATKVRQFHGKDLHGLKMDEAWLTNALGGGLI